MREARPANRSVRLAGCSSSTSLPTRRRRRPPPGGDAIEAIDARPVAGLTTGCRGAHPRPSGTEVELAIQRDGSAIDLAIRRELIRAQDVRSEVLADGRVGYLRVDTFSAGAAADFHSQLRAHLDAGIKDLVIDLRDDPGGFVDAAIVIASEFLEDGPLYQEESASGERRVVDARAGGLATDPAIDVAVLIDGGTASASDRRRGARRSRPRDARSSATTFGKGTIQEWTELPGENGGFRLSVAHWLLPDGASVDGVGVPPDIAIAGGGLGSGASLDDDPVVRAAIDTLIDDVIRPHQPSAVGRAGLVGFCSSLVLTPPRRGQTEAAACMVAVLGLLFSATKGV